MGRGLLVCAIIFEFGDEMERLISPLLGLLLLAYSGPPPQEVEAQICGDDVCVSWRVVDEGVSHYLVFSSSAGSEWRLEGRTRSDRFRLKRVVKWVGVRAVNERGQVSALAKVKLDA
jgi:hypothetical protein